MKKFLKNYWFILCMLTGIIAGCLVGAFAPFFGKKIEFLGTVFINMMFCVVVPMVFCSISSAIANMKSVKRAGKIMGVTVATFLVTAAIAGVLMYIVCRIFPLVDGSYTIVEGEVGEALGFGDMIVNFFTKPDFTELLSRRAILPLIVAAVLFGFGVQMNGGPETKTAQFLEDITNCIMKTVKLITYYAPIGFFGFFANLVATYGPELIRDYSRTLVIYYIMSFAYMFIFFPIYARFGGGKGGAKIMFSKLFRPAAVSFGTCSSVATIPTNMEAAEAIARQLKLRDIGGQVVIDFIEMRDKKHVLEVEKTLRTAMKNDRARHDVGRMSSFGLLELVRQRTGSSALSITMEPCPFCGGTGQRRNLEWQALQALREMRRALRTHGGDKYVFETTRELGLYLLNHKRDSLRDMEQDFGKCLEISIRP